MQLIKYSRLLLLNKNHLYYKIKKKMMNNSDLARKLVGDVEDEAV